MTIRTTHIYPRLSMLLALSLFPLFSVSQTLRGKITDENNEPIPYASVFIREMKQGTTSNTDGVFSINLPKGGYSIIFRCLGFETTEKKIEVKSDLNILNVTLGVRPYQIAPVIIGSKSEDPAYSIVRKAIAMAPYYQNQVSEFDAEVYLKGTLKVKKLSLLVKRAMRKTDETIKEGQLYLQESVNSIHFTAPNKYDQQVKMIRSNFPEFDGNSNNVMQFVNASLYQPQIGDVILPLSPYALNHYSYKYDGFSIQENRVINRIKVTPKRKSKQLVEGYMYIADDYWNLHEVDFTLESIVGTIRIKQTFGEIEDDAWLPISHNYEIIGKFMGNEGNAHYISSIKYSNVTLNSNLKAPAKLPRKPSLAEASKPVSGSQASPRQQAREKKDAEKLEKLMGKEVLTNREMHELKKIMDKRAAKADTLTEVLEIVNPVTVTIDSSARKADSTKWKELRPVMLTTDEVVVDQTIGNNLQPGNSLTDNDSLRGQRPNILKVGLLGKSWHNENKRQIIRFSGILGPDEFRFNTVDGFVIASMLSYRREFSDNTISIKPTAAYAFSRKKPMGTLYTSFNYSSMLRGVVGLNLGYTSMDFNQETGIENIVNTVASLGFGRNYMKLFENRFIELYHRIDPVNGLEIYTGATYANRKILENNTDFIIFPQNRDWYTSNQPRNELITADNLADNTAFIGRIKINYTPSYHYRMRGNRKLMLYSKYPTFKFQSRFGIPNIFNTDANFISWEVSANQTLKSGPSNRISYSFVYGDFISKKKLYFNDFAHFNSQISPVITRQMSHTYHNISYYKRSTDSEYGQILISYRSPYIALKYLPFLSNKIWLENLHFSSLFTRYNEPYYEFGYSISQIGALLSVGVFAGFEGMEFYSISVKVSIPLSGIDL